MQKCGFIMTRHVNSEQTNKYWNQSVKLINMYYPFAKIVIIDDNSNQSLINAKYEFKNLTIIQSEYPGRGELLPFLYYLKYKWFEKAIIIRDSVFIHKRLPFEIFNFNVLPLWHHCYDRENEQNIYRITSALSNNRQLHNRLSKNGNNKLIINTISSDSFNLCFGCQCFIKLDFLERLQRKYNINNLVNVVHNRTDRCALERVFGLLFCIEYPAIIKYKSLLGDILTKPLAFQYNYDNYENDIKHKKKITAIVKVWTGR